MASLEVSSEQSNYQKQSYQHLCTVSPPSDNLEPQCALNILHGSAALHCSELSVWRINT